MGQGELLAELLSYAIQLVGRIAIPVKTVQDAVGRARKQIDAFNLADGTLSQRDIAKKLGIDQGNLSRAADRWVKSGIAFWLGQGKERRLCHIYTIPYPHHLKTKRTRRWTGRGKIGKRS